MVQEFGGDRSIIIKKVKKGNAGVHGGAWKIAYADFVTAMMAFFLLLWLLNSVTQEQLEGIANHFSPTAVSESTSGAGGVLGGTALSEEGALTVEPSSGSSISKDLPPPKAGEGSRTPNMQSTEELLEEELKKKEEKEFEDAKKELEKKIKQNPAFKRLAESLLIENTSEGLRIQIVDQDGLAMFASGKADMYLHTKRIIETVVGVIEKTKHKLAISGHTDSVKFVTGGKDGTWKLSADRAESARRALEEFGLAPNRISQIVGKAATDPLLKDNPKAAKNRRLSIILMRGTGRNAQKRAKSKALQEALPGLNEIQKKEAVQ
jgi:chemotaxis protein MotB